MDATVADPLSAFLSSLGTVGPVGLTALGGWYLWLNSPQAKTRVTNQTEMHTENRDRLRDMASILVRLEDGHEEMLKTLNTIAEVQRRTAEILDRIENRGEKGHS